MSDKQRCANCGRSANLRHLGPKGRICSNCSQILGAKPCGTCGKVRRVAGRDSEDKPWCERCKLQVERGASDDRCRADILAAAARADPSVPAGIGEAALDAAVESTRALRRLARVVRADPDVLVVGPTSHPAVLDRFTKALVQGGAKLAPIYLSCRLCGRARPLRGNGLCGACDARTRKEPCGRCGNERVVDHRDTTGVACCPSCAASEQRERRLEELAATIIAAVRIADPTVVAPTVEAALCRIARNRPDRERLAEELTTGEVLLEPHRRTALVARLVAELRASGSLLAPARCEACGNDAEPAVSTRGVVQCRACAPRKMKPRRTQRATVGGRVTTVTRIRGTCAGCDKPEVILDEEGTCRACRDRAAHRCGSCGEVAELTILDGRRLCYRCVLTRELDELFTPVLEADPSLAALRNAILGAQNAKTARRWLQRSSGGRLLSNVVTHGERFHHEMLDAAGDDRSVRHLRALLVATGVLPEEDRSVERFEERFRRTLDAAGVDPADRRIARSWLRWSVLAQLRRRQERGEPMTHSVANALNKVRQVARLLEWICERGQDLSSLTQANLDEWFALPGALPGRARPFLVWARRRHHVPDELDLPPTERRIRRDIGDDATRWALARRVVVDDDLAADVRVAAALVLLYGQPLARIARLARDGVHRSADGTTVLDLDGHPLPIHEPFATLVEQLPVRRQHGVRDQFATNWLFPGQEAAHHVAPNTLGERLRRIGVEPRLMRNTARAQLAAEIPSSLLCEIIGINPNTAVAWANRAAGNWTGYAAERESQRVATQH